jgi:hypothetical protein
MGCGRVKDGQPGRTFENLQFFPEPERTPERLLWGFSLNRTKITGVCVSMGCGRGEQARFAPAVFVLKTSFLPGTLFGSVS